MILRPRKKGGFFGLDGFLELVLLMKPFLRFAHFYFLLLVVVS